MKLILTLALLILWGCSHGQRSWIGLSIGANHSQLRYRDSDGNLDKNLKGLPVGTASILFQRELRDNTKSSGYHNSSLFSTELGYKTNKIKDKSSTLLTTWSLQYLSGNILFIKRENSRNTVNPYYGGGVAFDWMVNGKQNLGFEEYNLSEDLNAFNLSLVGEFGLTYFISLDAMGSLGLSYSRGLSNLEKGPNEQALLHAIKLTLTVFFGF